ncbi:MAG TPA: endonuclease/exonuclease/phosphatase family protein [Opitutaceae bacterium]|nr:endonuclease/exonuclease/phosphatase family protein [Opitutaceae bacterium]
MPLPRFLSVLAALVAAAPGLLRAADPAAAPAPLELRVMTYNVRYASPRPPNAWPERRPAMRALIAREDPDVIGTQEGLYGQLRDLAADLPAYDWIGLGREGGSRGEFMAVFYRRDRFEPVAFDHFWLSDTPAVIGSITWGHRYHRMVTWVRFRDRRSGREFEFWNTHLDHEVEDARQRAAGLIRDRLALADPAVPLLLVGDFNCAAGASRAHEILTREAGLADTWPLAARRRNADFNTFNGFAPVRRESVRIDWILARRPAAVTEAAIVDHDGLAPAPSDHFAVTATVRF